METKIRALIKQECENYKTNFRGIDILEKCQNDFMVASKPGCYDFDSCPSDYDCLRDAEDYCNTTHANMSTREECGECWKRAFKNIAKQEKDIDK